MFDWNAELEMAQHRVAELEDMVSRLRDTIQQGAEDSTEATQSQRTLQVRLASLERAQHHQRFIEHKIASGAKPLEQLPYLQFAEICFKATKWMPRGEATESVRRTGAAFYTRGMQDRTLPTEATASQPAGPA
jgi:hypothetical protein